MWGRVCVKGESQRSVVFAFLLQLLQHDERHQRHVSRVMDIDVCKAEARAETDVLQQMVEMRNGDGTIYFERDRMIGKVYGSHNEIHVDIPLDHIDSISRRNALFGADGEKCDVVRLGTLAPKPLFRFGEIGYERCGAGRCIRVTDGYDPVETELFTVFIR